MDAERTETPLTERKVVRRGMIAALASLGAAAMLKLMGSEKAQAADGDSVVIGATAFPGMGAQSETRITANPAFNDIALQTLNGASAYTGLRRVAITGGVGGN